LFTRKIVVCFGKMAGSSFVQLFSGRKRASDVRHYFTYNALTSKSRCNVIDDGASKKSCGMLIAGKNPTNLKSHLSRRHEKTYMVIKEHESKLKEERKKNHQER
jgi:hypothetical protein